MNPPWDLIDGYFDDALDDSEARDLRNWLANDPAHLRILLEAASLHGGLARHFRPRTGESAVPRASAAASLPLPAAETPAEAVRPPTIPERLPARRTQPWPWPWPWPWHWRVWLWGGAALATLGILIRTPPAPEPGHVPAPVSAQLVDGLGTLALVRDGIARPVSFGESLQPGDVLQTTLDGSATLTYPGESTSLILGEHTRVRFLEAAQAKEVRVEAGSLALAVDPQPRGHPLRVSTAQADIRVPGSRLDVFAAARSTHVRVVQGSAQLSPATTATTAADSAPSAFGSTDLNAGGQAVIRFGGALEVTAIPVAPHPAVPAASAPPAAAPVLDEPPSGNGAVTRETWFGVEGLDVADLRAHPAFPDSPSARDYPTSLETTEGGVTHDLYGCRWRGFLVPPETGTYTFWIAADDTAELLLGTDDRPGSARVLARVPSYTLPREWTKHAEQESDPVELEAGRRYYLEVLHKEQGGGDHLAVAWRSSAGGPEVIRGEHLAPWTNPPASR